MIPKRKAPHLNRKQRRHPIREIGSFTAGKGWLAGGNFLLAGLLLRGGHNYQPPVSREDPNFGAQV